MPLIEQKDLIKYKCVNIRQQVVTKWHQDITVSQKKSCQIFIRAHLNTMYVKWNGIGRYICIDLVCPDDGAKLLFLLDRKE